MAKVSKQVRGKMPAKRVAAAPKAGKRVAAASPRKSGPKRTVHIAPAPSLAPPSIVAAALTLGDVRGAFRLIGAVRARGADPARWRAHMVRRLRKLLQADMVVSSELSFHAPPHLQAQVRRAREAGEPFDPAAKGAILHDRGWGVGADGRTWEIADEHVEFRPEDYEVLIAPQMGASKAATKVAPQDTDAMIAPDGKLSVRPRLHLRAGQYFLLSQIALPHVDTVDQLGVYRFDTARPFGRREARLLRLFHTELGRLWRADAMRQARDPRADLAPRLSQTLTLLMAGRSEKEVARALGISPHTVHNYVKALHQRFGVASRGELLAKANPASAAGDATRFRPKLTVELPRAQGRAPLK